jgi:hypothetical protein
MRVAAPKDVSICMCLHNDSIGQLVYSLHFTDHDGARFLKLGPRHDRRAGILTVGRRVTRERVAT